MITEGYLEAMRMSTPPIRDRIIALRNSLATLRPEEMPPWDLGCIYIELLDGVASENPDNRLAAEAERPKQTSNGRASVQVAAMAAVLDQLVLLYPMPVRRPRVSAPTGRNWMTEEW